jgi:hypothetical protein
MIRSARHPPGEAADRKKLAIAAIESANELIKRW